jgi:hypothetical protein
MYLLSHSAYQPKSEDGSVRNTVTYWGDVHPNGFNPEEELTTAEWDRIQSMAERAVTTRPGDDVQEASGEPDRMPCPHEDCDGQIVPLDELREWMTRGEWVASLERRQRRILGGVLMWLDNMGDRPPPSTNEKRIREWLWSWGRQRERTQQTGIGSFG